MSDEENMVRLARAQEAVLNLFLGDQPSRVENFRSAMRDLGVTVRSVHVDREHGRLDYEVVLPAPINYIRVDLKV